MFSLPSVLLEMRSRFCFNKKKKQSPLCDTDAFKSTQRLLSSYLDSLPCMSLAIPIRLFDPAHAVQLSACSSGESKVLMSRTGCRLNKINRKALSSLFQTLR